MTTTTLPPGFARFRLSESKIDSLRKDFKLLVPQVDLARPAQIKHVVASYKNVSGIYFWVMRFGESDDLYSIYVGKTKSMSYRLQNYFGAFQPHSPNDFKLQIFFAFLSEAVSGAALDLLFCRRSEGDLSQAEKEAIDSYKPLLNTRRQASAAAHSSLRDAFALYYRSAFENLLM
jgi:hypothetical protein